MFLELDKKKPDALLALQPDGGSITYGEMCQSVYESNQVLHARSLVFILCENTIGSIFAYLACLSNQAVPLLLSAGMDPALLETLCGTYEPEYIWLPKELVPSFPGTVLFDRYGYVLLKREVKPILLHAELALLLTTSGSTGSPKLVRQTYRNIKANAQSIMQYLEIDGQERPITTLPMNYTYGLSVINSHILAGAALLLTKDTYTQKPFWNFFQSGKATSIAGVPYTYEILKRMRFFRMELPTLKTMTQAGGKLSAELHSEFAQYAAERGMKFVVMYGQTEATARMAYLPFARTLEKCGSMGVAIPGGRFYLIDEKEAVIEQPEVVGELVYEGENVTLGYASCREDLVKGDERNGKLKTGDMAKRDVDGFYYIVGRKKRFLKIFGNRVNLDECERMIRNYFPDLDCACVGSDDHMDIYITDSEKIEYARSFLSEKLQLHKSAFAAHFCEEIPKNESGKVLYRKLGTSQNGESAI